MLANFTLAGSGPELEMVTTVEQSGAVKASKSQVRSSRVTATVTSGSSHPCGVTYSHAAVSPAKFQTLIPGPGAVPLTVVLAVKR